MFKILDVLESSSSALCSLGGACAPPNPSRAAPELPRNGLGALVLRRRSAGSDLGGNPGKIDLMHERKFHQNVEVMGPALRQRSIRAPRSSRGSFGVIGGRVGVMGRRAGVPEVARDNLLTYFED